MAEGTGLDRVALVSIRELMTATARQDLEDEAR